jgi:hypothetical protein
MSIMRRVMCVCVCERVQSKKYCKYGLSLSFSPSKFHLSVLVAAAAVVIHVHVE